MFGASGGAKLCRTGCKLHRRIVLGSADDLKSLASARRKERALHAVYGSEGDDLDRLLDTVKREKGKIDVLFTSAGKGEAAKLGEIQAEGRIWLRA